MGRFLHISVAIVLGFVTLTGAANAQSDPPGRIGRLAYINGPVSFHDEDQTQWAPAIVNRPLSTGDSLWTEPNARSEVSISGTRVRMDGATELDMLAIDDSQVRMQVPQGRLDIKAAAMDRPYEIVTPRGTVALQQPGDYYILAGSTQDPTLLGVRSGAAQITSLNGQTLAVRAGEVGEVSGDSDAPVLRTIQGAPPPMQPYWADRDRQISYDQSQYVPVTVTGYEDLDAYGVWSNQGDYGQIWTPRFVPVGWEPYRNGHWVYMQPWGWTWVDEQPWGFAPFHYGRWVNVHRRWSWVPPAREAQPVYAPALVSFIGGGGAGLLLASRQPSVGWFPLGPREVYVPPYTANRDYFRNVNRASVRDQALIDARYQWAQEHRDAERPPPADPRFTHVNQRFATVVPQQAFQQSRPMERAVIKVAPDKLAAAPIAPVAAPPVVTRNAEPSARAQDGKPLENRANVMPSDGPVAHTAFANMETIGKPAGDAMRPAPGPRVVKRADATPGAKPETGPAKANEAPPLSPRTGAAPPPLPGANEAKGAPVPAEHPALVKPEESKTRPQPPKLPAGDSKAAPDTRPAGPKPPLATERTEPPKAPAVENKAVPSLKPPPLENKAVPSPQPPTRPPESRPADARPAAQPERPAAAQRPAPAPEPPHPAATAQQPPHPAAAPPRPAPEPPRAAAPPPPRPAPAPAAQAPRPAPPPQQAHAPEPPRQAPPPPAPKPQAAPAPKEEKK